MDSKVCIRKQAQSKGISEACQTEKDRGHVRYNLYQRKMKDREACCSDTQEPVMRPAGGPLLGPCNMQSLVFVNICVV